ncbi:MAG: hypothetical protein WCT32_04240 [Patescibacteria group bacterium]
MSRVANVGTIEWTTGVIFEKDRLKSHIAALAATCSDNVPEVMARYRDEAIRELSQDLLPLRIFVRLDQPVPDDQFPGIWTEDDGSRLWVANGQSPHDGQQVHPFLYILRGLARWSGHAVQISLSQFGHAAYVTFISNEDIRQPSAYLNALASKMARWAAEGRWEILNDYTRQKVEAILADLETAAGTIRTFLAMVKFLQSHGVRPSGEAMNIRRILALRSPGGSAGPSSDIWDIANIFQQEQQNLAQVVPPELRREMDALQKRGWQE